MNSIHRVLYFFVFILFFKVCSIPLQAGCGVLTFSNPVQTSPTEVRVDVNYLNIGVTLLNFEVDVEFTDHQVSIDYSKTNSSTGSGYSAFQPSSNGQIVRIAGSNFSFGSSLICSIYFNLPAGADTDIEFFSIFQFLSYEIPNINDPNNPIVVQEVCGNETSHNSEYYDKPIYSISGNVLNLPYGVDLENVEVEATSPTIDKIDVTNSSGQFSLTGLEAMENYDIACQKINDDPLCGINSLDVTVIQRHIRGVEPFLSTWQYLAADVSGDELVTTLDILKIQALLLNGAGLTKKWTFIPASTYGGLGFSPWPFDEYMQFNNLSQSHSNEDFYAVKGGDVNGLGCSTPSQIRSNSDGEILIRNSRLFRVGNIQAEHGQEVLIPVFAPRFKQQSLFTLSFHLASEFLEVIEIVAPSLPNFTEKDYTIERDDQEIIDIFWFTMEERGITISPNEPILYIKASVKQSFRNI